MVREVYAKAIAAELRYEDAGPAWAEFERVTAWAEYVMRLLAYSIEVDRAEADGMESVVTFSDDEPRLGQEPKAITMMFIAGKFEQAADILAGRNPMTRQAAESIRGRAFARAATLRATEQAISLVKLAERSVAIQRALRQPFWVSDVDQQTVVNIRSMIADVIEHGKVTPDTTLPGFINKAQANGAANLTRARLQTVYRTNLSTSYNDGRVEALRSPQVQSFMPLMELQEIRDSRSRQIHAMMNGYISTTEQFETMGIVPPNGYNCRGTVRGITLSEGRRRGFINEDDSINWPAIRSHNGDRQRLIDSGAYPDDNFSMAA